KTAVSGAVRRQFSHILSFLAALDNAPRVLVSFSEKEGTQYGDPSAGGRLPPLQRTDAHRHGASGPGRAVGGDRPRLAAAGLRQLSAQGTAAPGRRPGPPAGELLHRAPARRRRRAGPGRQVRVSAAGRAAGAPPPARPERRAVLPRFPGRPAGPGRAV